MCAISERLHLGCILTEKQLRQNCCTHNHDRRSAIRTVGEQHEGLADGVRSGRDSLQPHAPFATLLRAPKPDRHVYICTLAVHDHSIGNDTGSAAENDVVVAAATTATRTAARTAAADNGNSCGEGGVRAQRRKTRMSYNLLPEEVATAGKLSNGERGGGEIAGGATGAGGAWFSMSK